MQLSFELRAFERDAKAFQHTPCLELKGSPPLLNRSADYAARARASLTGAFEKRAPHERNLKSDVHITGSVGGKEAGRPCAIVWGERTYNGKPVRFSRPITRPIKPISAKGFTTLHLAFEAVTKAHLEFGTLTAQGRRANSKSHIAYLERQEAAVTHDDRLNALNPAAYAEYQERDGALSIEPEHGACLFTNVPGNQEDRIDLFRRIGEREIVYRPPRIAVNLQAQSPAVAELAKELRPGGSLEKLTVERDAENIKAVGANAERIREFLVKCGWKPSGKPQASGVVYDSGKAGRVQMRVVGELPAEVSHEARVRILEGFCKTFEDLGVPYIAVMHAPGPDNHERNWHFHLVYYDRPVRRFSGRVEDHCPCPPPGASEAARRKHLKLAEEILDPSVQAQVGRWDFDVEYTRRYDRSERRVRPFAQEKDRRVTRSTFIPRLREQLCNLTNHELERAGVDRRVSPKSSRQLGICQEPGDHLGDVDNKLELAGVPSTTGSENERRQADARMQMLEQRHELREECVFRDRTALVKKLRASGMTMDEIRPITTQWILLEQERIKLLHIQEVAEELSDRLFSRTAAIHERALARYLACSHADTPRHIRERKNEFLERANAASSHEAALKVLFADHLQIALAAKDRAEEIAREQQRLFVDTAIGRSSFDIDLEATPMPHKPASKADAAQQTGHKSPREGNVNSAAGRRAHVGQKIRERKERDQVNAIFRHRIPVRVEEHEDRVFALISIEDAERHGIVSTIELTSAHQRERAKAAARRSRPEQPTAPRPPGEMSMANGRRAAETTVEAPKSGRTGQPGTTRAASLPSNGRLPAHPRSIGISTTGPSAIALRPANGAARSGENGNPVPKLAESSRVPPEASGASGAEMHSSRGEEAKPQGDQFTQATGIKRPDGGEARVSDNEQRGRDHVKQSDRRPNSALPTEVMTPTGTNALRPKSGVAAAPASRAASEFQSQGPQRTSGVAVAAGTSPPSDSKIATKIASKMPADATARPLPTVDASNPSGTPPLNNAGRDRAGVRARLAKYVASRTPIFLRPGRNGLEPAEKGVTALGDLADGATQWGMSFAHEIQVREMAEFRQFLLRNNIRSKAQLNDELDRKKLSRIEELIGKWEGTPFLHQCFTQADAIRLQRERLDKTRRAEDEQRRRAELAALRQQSLGL